MMLNEKNVYHKHHHFNQEKNKMTTTTNLEVATTICEQIGGTGKLRAMIGADNWLADSNSLMFSFKGCRKMNKCRITLDANDTYTIELFKFSPSKLTCDVKEVSHGVYFDQLIPVIEKFTGLYLSM